MSYIILKEHIPGKNISVEWLFLTLDEAVKKMNSVIKCGKYKQIGKYRYLKEKNIILEIIK